MKVPFLNNFFDGSVSISPPTKNEKIAAIAMVGAVALLSHAPTAITLWRTRKSLNELYFQKGPFVKFTLGVATGAVYYCLFSASLYGAERLLTACSPSAGARMSALGEYLKTENHYKDLQKTSFLEVCVIAPIVEELLFRGAIQSFLKLFLPPLQGVAAAGVLFGAAHLIEEEKRTFWNFWKKSRFVISSDLSALLQATNACIGGIFLGQLKENFGMWAVIGAHFGNNVMCRLAKSFHLDR